MLATFGVFFEMPFSGWRNLWPHDDDTVRRICLRSAFSERTFVCEERLALRIASVNTQMRVPGSNTPPAHVPQEEHRNNEP